MDPITNALSGTPPDTNTNGAPAAGQDLNELKSTVHSLKGSLDVLTAQNAQLMERLANQTKTADTEDDDDNVPPEFDDEEKKIERAARRVTQQELGKRDNAAQTTYWNARSDAEFPDLLDRGSDFYREVFREVHDSKITKDKNDPAAVYNACARVKHRFEQEGKTVNRVKPRAAGAGGFDSGGYAGGSGNSRNRHDAPLSDGELYIASKIGRTPEQYKASRDRALARQAERRDLMRA